MSRIHTITLEKPDATLVSGFYPGLTAQEYEELSHLIKETMTAAEATKVIKEFAAKLGRLVIFK